MSEAHQSFTTDRQIHGSGLPPSMSDHRHPTTKNLRIAKSSCHQQFSDVPSSFGPVGESESASARIMSHVKPISPWQLRRDRHLSTRIPCTGPDNTGKPYFSLCLLVWCTTKQCRTLSCPLQYRPSSAHCHLAWPPPRSVYCIISFLRNAIFDKHSLSVCS